MFLDFYPILQDVNVCLLPLEYLSALKPFKNEVPQGHHSFQVCYQQWLICKQLQLTPMDDGCIPIVSLFPLQLVSNAQSSQDPVGHPMMHQAAFHQATGEAQYYDDIPPVQGELFIFMVTSTRAHAKIM